MPWLTAEKTARTRTSPGPGAGASSGLSSARRLPANQRARGRAPGLPGAADGSSARRVLDPGGQEQVAAARREGGVGQRDGPREVADASFTPRGGDLFLDARVEYPTGRDAVSRAG